MMDPGGLRAIVTGASSGIGKAISLGLAREGLSLCLVGRNPDRLDAVASGVRGGGGRAAVFAADLASGEAVVLLADRIEREFPEIDILIHSAGDFSMGMLESAPVEDLDRQYRVNVRAPFLLTQCLLPLIRRRKGQVVFVNSSAGLKAGAKVSQYAATKHALKAIADSLREEVNADGVRVVSVYPGRTASPMQELVHRMEGRAYEAEQFMQPEDVATIVINALSLPRTAEVTDIVVRPMKKMKGEPK